MVKYEDSGVDFERARRAKAAISQLVKSTWGNAVLSDTGAFGGLFRLGGRYEDPVLVSSIDGVGTKVRVAQMASRFNTVGRDLVNHCVNDILVQGARPLFFLDYVASGRLDPERVASIVDGVAQGCKENGCALIGGETAEMPDIYHGDDFDLAGCIVGVVERKKIIDGSTIRPGDVVYAIPSTGLHTNGYSLARKIFFDVLGLSVNDMVPELGCTVADELLKVHASYLEDVFAIMESAAIKGMAHITGGGIVDNLPRILPPSCDAHVRKQSLKAPPVFEFLRTKGNVDPEEMFRVFNMGAGMLLVVDRKDGPRVEKSAARAFAVGDIQPGSRRVVFV